jgi:GntR family transcriptional regulator
MYTIPARDTMSPLALQLSDASGVPRYRQIVDRMSDLVRSGRLAPGTRLPSVRELALQLSVSLITVRRAYSDLEHSGLVVRVQGQGTFVADDVAEAARTEASREAKRALGDAVTRAHHLGLAGPEIVETVAACVGALVTEAQKAGARDE